MEAFCAICEIQAATTYCRDCTKINFYCEKCYETSHKADHKRCHKVEKIELTLKDSEMCPEHPKKVNEYVCLTCNTQICSDCLVFGKHKGHQVGYLEQGFEKLATEFKGNLSLYETNAKDFDESKEAISAFFSNNIEKLKDMKAKTEENFQELIITINKKRAEVIAIINKEICERTNKKENIEELGTKIKVVLEKLKVSLASPKTTDYKVYNAFLKQLKELKELNTRIEGLRLVAKQKGGFYPPLSLEAVTKEINNLQITKEMLSNLPSMCYQGSIVKDTEDGLLLQKWVAEACENKNVHFKLLWKGSVDGFEAGMFHMKCDDKGPTLTIILSNHDRVFGGYTTKSWGDKGYVYDPAAFTYSLTHKTKHAKQRITGASIYPLSYYGPIFGGGYDIAIHDNCNIDNKNFSDGGHTYEFPPGVNKETYLAGSYYFTVKEIEVYSVLSQQYYIASYFILNSYAFNNGQNRYHTALSNSIQKQLNL
eukprot:TRINITY_DN2528_c0_g1_i1.p1 TRINITY_DN2528_c0_g1~~TRINITY_DN2528_c0_g1_i1.p1  ORF type:complete len:507 (-),score=47.31 TRINITY_DN2528_c0_g1_i1:59-1504(-)